MKSIIKELFNKIIRNVGFELVKFNPRSSLEARIRQLFFDHKINTVLDVGSNAGQYGKLLRKSGYKGRIISFEPLSKAHAKIVLSSRKDPKWTVAPRMALGNEDGIAKLNIAANYLSSSILDMTEVHINGAPGSNYVNSEDVQTNKLDSIANKYLGKDDIVFLKIDAQGFEYQILLGAKRTLPSITGMQIEFSLLPLYKEQLIYRELLDIVNDLGFDLYDIIPCFWDHKTGRLLQFDGIFFRKL